MAFHDMTSLYRRLVTYKPLSQSQVMIYCTRLAECGYIYAEQDMELECESCKTRIPLRETWPDMEKTLSHESNCMFLDVLDKVVSKTDELLELASVEAVSGAEAATPGESLQGVETLSEDSYLTSPVQFGGNRKPCTVETVGDGPGITSDFQLLEAQESSHMQNLSTQYNKDIDPRLKNGNEQSLFASSSSQVSEYSNMFTEYIDFPQLFTSEYLGINSRRDLKHSSPNERDCDKNPGHFGYFNANSLKPEQIAKQFRCTEMLSVLKIMSDLTVRIVVMKTSINRRNGNQHKVRVGTGFVIEHLAKVKKCESRISSETSKFKSFKKLMSIGKKKNFGSVFIQTSRHLVYNDDEAQNTVVEFFFDIPDRKDIVSVEGKYLLNSTTPGDSQCLLVCECSDSAFAQRLNQLQCEFFALSERLSLKAKKGMSKKLFMIHHPHGSPKVVSYGDFVTVKYKYESGDDQRQPYLTRLKGNIQADPDVSVYRKTLFYAADTCPGSCGAPILTFSPRQSEANGDVIFKLDIWMHHGVETSHKLGASNLKVCAVEDFIQSRGQSDALDEDSEDETSLGNEKVTSPVYKVITTPSHAEYTLYQRRFDSFMNWKFSHIMKPEYLASSGFFYTGVSDCVRCFQCGLGLRSWKQGDDVITEHEKYRPTCPYLKSLPRGQEDDTTGAVASLAPSNQSSENLTLKLLKSENRTLKKQLTCKVCYKSDIKDVFLPCGELYACSECSKLLTHCPSCDKAILATVTVYLT